MSSVGSLLSGSPASLSSALCVAQGSAVIAVGTQGENIADALVTASSVIVAACEAGDAALKFVGVALNPGIGFSIIGNAIAAADVNVSYAVLKY